MSAQKKTAENTHESSQAMDLIDKATADFQAGHFKNAEADFSNALEKLRQQSKDRENNSSEAAALEGVGRARTWLGKYKEADQDLAEAGRIIIKQYGVDSKERLVNDLYRSELYVDMEDYEQAYNIAFTVLSQLQEQEGQNGLEVAHALSKVGVALVHLNRLEEAEPILSKALGLRNVRLKESHRLVGESIHDLSYCHAMAENYTVAGALGRKALKVREDALGPDHPEVGVTLYNLASQYLRTSRYEKAETAARRGLEIFRNSLFEDHPLTIRLSERLSSACMAQLKAEEAEQLNKNALLWAERRYGHDSPLLVPCLVGLGSAYLYRNDFRNAESYFERALKLMEKVSELNTSLEYQLLNQLSYCYMFQFKLGDVMRLTPNLYRARHTSSFSSTIDLIRKAVQYTAKEIELASKKD